MSDISCYLQFETELGSYKDLSSLIVGLIV